jgi:CO/xanthine dehydrogenase FAD-binding subunit
VVNKKEICYSTYCGDVAPALLVLNAKIGLSGLEGTREITLEDFYSGDGKAPLALKPAEILTEIVIPGDALQGASSYHKFANRESIDFPILGTAFWASTGNGKYRLAYTAVDRKPVRGRQVEAFLKGKDLSEANMNDAADLASREAKPVKTSVYSPSYKRRLMGLLLKEAMRRSN